MRGIFFDEDTARTVVARLVQGGWEASAARDPLAGEDDDEDHPWAVRTDAPVFTLELLVEEYDGWLDDALADGPVDGSTGAPTDGLSGGASDGPPTPAPVELPTAPVRIKRPDLAD